MLIALLAPSLRRPPPPQVTRLHSFAFPLAEVAVAVMAAHPDLVPLLAARLHQVGGCLGGVEPHLLWAAAAPAPHSSAHTPQAPPLSLSPAQPLPSPPESAQVCPLTVPKYSVFKTGADEDGYLKQLGYRIRTDEDTGQVRRRC